MTTMPKTGDIYVSQWGYDQTNTDFFVVTRTTKCTISLAPIGQILESTDTSMSGHVLPDPEGTPIGEVIPRRKVSSGGYVHLDHSKYARPWDGKPQRYSTWA